MFSVKAGVQMAYSVLAGHRSHSASCFEALFMTLGLHVNLLFGWLFFFFFLPVSHCVDYCSFLIQSEAREGDFSCSVLPSQDCFGHSGTFCFHNNFKLILDL